MQYFGIPTCPYCKKRVNLIRTWSLKKQGEFQCPRCGGISNIYLSPLIYVAALLALFAGGAIYFFHKFILDDVSLETAVQVFLPFAGFFLLSVFFVYLAKPVIKKVSREDMHRKRFGRKPAPASPVGQTGHVYYDREDYPPQPMEPVTPSAPSPAPVRIQQSPPPARPAQRPAAPAQPTARQQGTTVIRPPVPVNRRPAHQAPAPAEPEPVKTTSYVEAPEVADDFFAKYDDPDYVQRRIREINGGSK